MRLDGFWHPCADDEIRPILRGELLCGAGAWVETPFLVDTGADRTVLKATTMRRLQLPTLQPTEHYSGVGGRTDSVSLDTRLRLRNRDGQTLVINARFPAFTDPNALDMSVLGRDITNLFALIVDRPGDLVCLLAKQHRYVIQTV
jgi:hypothetical protein